MKYLKFIIGAMLLALFAACGGGGGSAGGSPGGSGSSGGLAGSPSLVVTIHDAAGASVTGISVGGGFVARATLKDAQGGAVVGKLVTFALTGSSIASLTPSTQLSNANGVAEVVIAPASISSIGAASLSASSDIGGDAVTGQMDFAVQPSSLELSAVAAGTSTLPSGGNTAVQVTALIGNKPSTGVPVNVSFAVSCGRINGADTGSGGVSVTTNGSGIAAAVYDAVKSSGELCSGSVTLTASAAGATPKSTSINVAAPTANAVVFVSATPAQIFVAGSGAVDQSIAKFKVLSSAGTTMANVGVKFSIVTNPGGVGIGAAGSTSAVVATTNSSGEASVSVFSGTIPGPVKLRSELESAPSIFAESQNLTVASGPPSQRFMSLSVEAFNIEGWSRDGTSTQLTVRVADRQGNPVENGTVVNFTAEGGQVARSCATALVNGLSKCSVTFETQNPRPLRGRASVLAYLEGTKDYVDVNGNNRYDAGTDTLINLGEAYRDDNENGAYDSSAGGEFLIPRGGSSSCAGAGGSFPARLNTCDDKLSTTVRQQAVILFSSTNPDLELLSLSTGGMSFLLRSLDNRLLPLPVGTTVSATARDVNSNDGATCSIADAVGGSPIPVVTPGANPAEDLATRHGVAFQDCRVGDEIKINVKVPSGLVTTFSFIL